jgi:hypothetical protein
MAPSTFILTSSPFIRDQIALASFVPNVRQPHQDAKRPYAVKSSDYTIQPDDDFEGLINAGSKSFFNIFATKLAVFSLRREEGSELHVVAKKGNIYSLNSPNSLFEEIAFGKETGEGMQKWFELCKHRNIKPRFVVAYRTFVDAQVSRGHHCATAISGNAMVPTSTLHGDPSGIADISLQLGRQASTDTKGVMNTPGERVYAICYRRINISRREGKLVPLLEQANKWEPFAAVRGGPGEEYFQAGLLDGDDADGCEIHGVETAAGEKLYFGIPIDPVDPVSDEDEEEDD